MLKTLIDLYDNKRKEQAIFWVITLLIVLIYAVISERLYNVSEKVTGLKCAILAALLYILMPIVYLFFKQMPLLLSVAIKNDELICSKSRIDFPTTFAWEKNKICLREFITDEQVHFVYPMGTKQSTSKRERSYS